MIRRVGFNLLFLVPGETGGMETAARMIIPEIKALRPDLELIAFVCKEGAAQLSAGDLGAEIVPVAVSGRGRLTRSLGEQTLLPIAARRRGVDLLHSLGNTAPAIHSMPTVTSINDVIYSQYPEAHSMAMRLGMRLLVPLAARYSTRVIAISQATSDEIMRETGIGADKIDVVPLAGRAPVSPTPESELRERLELGDSRLVLSASARRGHKNLSRLLQAFARLTHEPAPILVLPGYSTGTENSLLAEARKLCIEDRVKLLGWVSDADLEGLYAASDCLAFPSLAEGFGLPVLEAMQRGLPVATSNVSAMPEVGGDAVLYFDPIDVDQIAKAIDQILSDQALATRLRDSGLRRAEKFSWRRTAELILESYERAFADG